MNEIKYQLRFIETMATTAHEALSTFVEAVIFYHSKQKSTSGKFVGSKERVRIGLNMYRSSPLDYPKEKVYLFQTNGQEETISAQEVQGEEEEQEEADKEVSTNPQEEVEDDYDTDRENEHPVEEDDDDDSLTFMREVTTRSGRTVQVKFFS